MSYQKATKHTGLLNASTDDPETVLKQIDALVLDAYRMPPRLERELLDLAIIYNPHQAQLLYT